MFAFPKSEQNISKCLFTSSEMPELINEKHPPVKKKPFSTIQSHPFTHTVSEFCLEVSSSCLHIDQVDLILPEEIYSIIGQKLNRDESALRYARVKISLLELLSGDFFNQYIKAGLQDFPPESHGTGAHDPIGNILMRSEGRDGVDHLFTLHEGQLEYLSS
jgi:ribonuclease P/MRP protein subunit RPP40